MHSLVDLHGKMPEALKVTELRPFLKKPDADYEQFSNFRPISNLKMMLKVAEKVVAYGPHDISST